MGQVDYWNDSVEVDRFVYFIQQGHHGPVKIGLARNPRKRMSTLQTGNPTELHLRHVVPGERDLETQLHHRFREARIRGEWFGDDPERDLSYLQLILIYAEGLSAEHISCFEHDHSVPALVGNQVMSAARIAEMRRDLAQMLDRYDYFPVPPQSFCGREEVDRIMESEYGLSRVETEGLARELRAVHHRPVRSMRRRQGKKLGHRIRPR